MVNNRVDEIKDNVFKIPSRLNSTWGGTLVDMVRSQKYLEVIKEEKLVKNAEVQGKRLLTGLVELSDKYSDKIFNARGKGLMCAFDCFSPEKRDELKKKLYTNNLILIGCGAKTIRFRPPLVISSEEIDKILSIIDKTLKSF
jgi:L-lysine 6-transaminase